MSYPTKSALVHYGNWDDETRSHPAMKWMEDYTRNVVDTRSWPSLSWQSYLADDHVLHKTDGTTATGGAASWQAIQEVYGPFTENSHQAEYLACHETETGWTMIGQANVYLNLVGPQGAGEQRITDSSGKEWDIVVPSAFRFDYKKVEDGIRLSRTDIHNDSFPAISILMKRGVIKV